MNEEVRLLLARALRRSTHPGLRERLTRCEAPAARIDDLYAAAATALDPVDGPADDALVEMLATAINLALPRGDRTAHVGRLVSGRHASPVPLASRDRPSRLTFDRATFDGSERETTVMLPGAGDAIEEASDQVVQAFFAAKPDAPLRPEATGRLVELAGDTSARSRRELRAEVVSACAERIAMLARHRDERPMWEQAENEEALLANVDAIGACGGDCVRTLVAWRRTVADDPWATWAAVFTLACFDGTDALEAILRELDELPLDAADHVMPAAEALLVAPHPHIPELALDLLASRNPITRAIGIEVLGRRKLLTPEQVRHHARDANIPVLAAALRASRVLDLHAGVELVLPFLQHRSFDVAWAAARQLARWRRPEPYFEVRKGRCRALGRKALELLIQFGDASDLDCFEEIVAREPATRETLSAVARFGEASVWAYLLHHLADPELVDAAARGLETLFGSIVPRRETRSATAWRDAIAKLTIVPGVRLRSGKPWHPAALASEILRGDIDRAEVQGRMDELALRAAIDVDVDLALWSPDTRGTLAAAMNATERTLATFRAGSWTCVAAGFRESSARGST